MRVFTLEKPTAAREFIIYYVKPFPTNPKPLTNLKLLDDNSIDGVDGV